MLSYQQLHGHASKPTNNSASLAAQVTGRGGMLSYEQLKAAGGLGDMTGLDAMFEDPDPAPVDPEVANAIFQHLLAAGGLLGEDPGDGEGG